MDHPGPTHETLLRLSGHLFQWAATAVRYIDAPVEPEARLKTILAHPNEL